MSSVGRKQVRCDQKIPDQPDAPLKGARDALCRVEEDLARAVLEMAEADCKGGPKPERRLREIRLAYRDAIRNLDVLRNALPAGPRRGADKAGVKGVRNPL